MRRPNLDDRSEIVIEKDNGGCFAGDIGAAASHSNANIGGFQRGGAAKGSPEAIAALCRLSGDRVASVKVSVNAMAPSPVMATISPLAFKALTIASFCSGMIRANTVVVFTRRKGRIVQCLEYFTGDDIVEIEPSFAGNCSCGRRIVSGDHDHSNPGGAAITHGIRNAWS